MRFRFVILTTMATVVAAVPLGLGIAADKSPAKSDSQSTIEDSPEIPAVPYVTLALVRDPAVHAELRLSNDQIKAVSLSVAEVDESFWQLRDVPVSKAAAQIAPLYAQLRQSLKAGISPSQLDRFDQIVLQARGWKALVASDISERLKLSSDQVARLKGVLKEATKDREAAEKDLVGQSAAVQERTRDKLRKAESKRFTDVLTTRQQNEFSGLLGKPFDLSKVTQVGCVAPELRGVTAWINSRPLTLQELRGKVVVVHFWAFGCINCIRNLPHYQGWYEKFPQSEITIIGIQTPETDSERKLDNLKRNVVERRIEYPVVMDGASDNWKAWGTNMWPSVYLIDKQGRVRNWWYGELNWEGAKGEEFMRKRIEALLSEK